MFLFLPNHYHLESQQLFDCSRFFAVYLVNKDFLQMHKNPENPLIRDLILERLSLARTQKEEFASVLNSNNDDIEALFKVLEDFSQN